MNKALKVIAAAALTAALAGCSSSKKDDSSASGTETPAVSAVNPHGYQITPLEAAQLPLALPVAAVTILVFLLLAIRIFDRRDVK